MWPILANVPVTDRDTEGEAPLKMDSWSGIRAPHCRTSQTDWKPIISTTMMTSSTMRVNSGSLERYDRARQLLNVAVEGGMSAASAASPGRQEKCLCCVNGFCRQCLARAVCEVKSK